MDTSDTFTTDGHLDTNRFNLHFAENVEVQFAFLLQHDFVVVRRETTIVRFESPMCGISFYHGRQSFEIGLEIESRPFPGEIFTLSDFIKLVDREQGDNYRNFASRTPDGVANGVQQLAKHFLNWIGPVIFNDEQVFVRLKLQRIALTNEYVLATNLLQARKRAEIAWRSKDYLGFINAFEPVRSLLTSTEVKKVEYAEKQQSASANHKHLFE